MLKKPMVVNLFKISLAAGLIFWMMEQGKLDFGEFGYFISNPRLLSLLVITWLIAPAFLAALRWRYLLLGAGYQVSMGRAMYLQLIGLFFNSAMPGSVGGDLIKVAYVIKENPDHGKTNAMMTILLDRIIGLFGMFTIGSFFVLWNLQELYSIDVLSPIVSFVLIATAAILAFLGIAIIPYKDGKDPILKILDLRIPGMWVLKKVYVVFRQYSSCRSYILKGWALSVFMQGLIIFLFWQLALVLIDRELPFSSLAAIYPLGALVTALPVAPGGLGVGHVAFDRLFLAIGYGGGANVFNLYALGFLALNLLGAIPYIAFKRQSSESRSNPIPVNQNVTS